MNFLKDFTQQFSYEPVIENAANWKQFARYVLVGMGGSHLAGDVLQTIAPGFNLSVHQDYGLPPWPLSVLQDTLVIVCSHSGNTEEAIAAFEEAREKGVPVVSIAKGGKLLSLAKTHSIPYIQIPDTGIQPRMALGFLFRALAKMTGREDLLAESARLAAVVQEDVLWQEGERIAHVLENAIPLVYASQRNYALAYIWKIVLNEGAKIPAFYNVFPELNHNEMEGFGRSAATKRVSEALRCVFLVDSNDTKRIQARMEATRKLYEEKGIAVETVELAGSSATERVFLCVLLAHCTARALAQYYGSDPEHIPMVEEFKKRIA